MSRRPIIIIGTGGAGRETYALLRDIERHEPQTWDFRGFAGTEPPDDALLARLKAPFLGDPYTLVERIPEAESWAYTIGIGSPQHRRTMFASLASQGLRLATLIHPTAIIGPDVEVEGGSVICANSVLTTNVRIGFNAQLNIGSVVAHDARIGDFVTFAQRVNVAGNVEIGDDAILFTGAAVLPGVKVGSRAIVGAGALVRSDVAAGTTVVGVPARSLD